MRIAFVEHAPSFTQALVPLCFLSMLLFTRHPLRTNFIFDEQEALLANPYVRAADDPEAKLAWLDAFRRDFWGLPPSRSIGSYRPLPNLVWRALWVLGARQQSPFLHHWVNIILHGVNGALIVLLVHRLTRDRLAAWFAGAAFVACGVLTEAVSGVVGLADVLGMTGALLALTALALPLGVMPFAVFGATLVGLYSKESALSIVPLAPLLAFLAAHLLFPEKPRRLLRTLLALVATSCAFVLYVELRRRMFPAAIAPQWSMEANADKSLVERGFAAVLRWYAQPALPRDPINNPLLEATPSLRLAGALRVYARGLLQVLFPWRLSGDYSARAEPIPERLVFPESVLGALGLIVPVAAALVLGSRALLRARGAKSGALANGSEPKTPDKRIVVAFALFGLGIAYFPVSNIPILLPTVRAERFWYLPALGTSILVGISFARLFASPASRSTSRNLLAWGTVTFFFVLQATAARLHANDYTDDLVFWEATKQAVPASAKAHLNYSVMVGARLVDGKPRLEERLAANRIAIALAPRWPMANVYLGDVLCRLHRVAEAWPNYRAGFALAPNDQSLIALGLQCLWDEGALKGRTEGAPDDADRDRGHPAPLATTGPAAEVPELEGVGFSPVEGSLRRELDALAAQHPNTWLQSLAREVLEHGDEFGGVNPKYRPRTYDEGPKSE